MTTYLLGIDVSTTATKALLMDETGQVVTTATTAYSFETPRPLWSEQSPSLFWEGTVQSIRNVLQKSAVDPAQIAALGLTGQMHGLVLLDAHGAPLRPCILWNDQRTAEQCAWITDQVGPTRILHLTGNPVLTGFTAPKIIWVRENEPQVYERIAHILLPKDFVRYRLTGEFFSDVSDASGTSLFDVRQRKWSREMLDALGLERNWLPEITESPVISTKLSIETARVTGLRAGTPLVGGAGDQAAGAIGIGIVREGQLGVTIGTSGVVFGPSDTYRSVPQGQLHVFCHAVPGKWHLMGVTLSAAGSFRWYRDVLGDIEKEIAEKSGRDVYDVLTAEAALAPPGCEGLLFLPYLTGERTPYADPTARGAFLGLTVRHRKPHLTRSVLEGVSFGLCDSLDLIRTAGLQVNQVRATGGGARSSLWLQILADVFNTEIAAVHENEGAALGAALLASVGAGVFPSVESATDTIVRDMEKTSPGPARSIYAGYYPIYRALYPALKAEFSAIGQVVAQHSVSSNP